MSNLEDQLRAALRRTEPGRGFARSVLERAQSALPADARSAPMSPEPVPRRPLRRLVRGAGIRWAAAIAAAILLIVAGVRHEVQVRQERAQAELATRQAQIALRIASARLNVALREIQRLNEGPRQTGPAKNPRRPAEEL